jgi:probable HAF family extracellular repeat protein
MKQILNSIVLGALTVIVAAAQRQPQYLITDLGPAGSTLSQATGINNRGLISGFTIAPDRTSHAIVWYRRQVIDISQPGLGGSNSSAIGLNESGLVLVQAETSANDPENFCGYGTSHACVPALWRNGLMTPLPLLGGNNGAAGGVNNRGEAAGAAETGTSDSDCPTGPLVNGTGPLKFDFAPVIWGTKPGQFKPLPLLGGDRTGMALAINDVGQAVGISGSCSNTLFPPFTAAPHAVLWDSDGSVVDLLNLGGTGNPSVLAAGNAALAINNRGQVTGTSSLAENVTHHPFLWTRETGMVDLDVLPGDNIGAGLAINNHGEVVGASIAGPDPLNGSPRAALWRNGQKFDLNSLALPTSPLFYLLTAFGINDAGQIVGFGVTNGELHGFLATPVER